MHNKEVQKQQRSFGPPHNSIAEKPKDFKTAIKDLYKYIKPYILLMAFAFILAVLSAILTIIGPDKIKELVNEITNGIITGINMTNIKKITIYLSTIYILSAMFSYFQSFIMVIVTNKLAKRLRKDITDKINKLPLKYFDTTSYGDVLSRVTNDVDTISRTFNQSIANLVSAITLFIGVTIMMFVTNSLMAITGIGATVLGFIFMIIILSKSQKYFKIQQEQLGTINGHIEEIYSGHNVVKVYNGIKDSNKEFDKINEKLYSSAKKSQFMSGLMQPIMGFIGNFGYVAICIVGAALVINGNITIGVVVSFMIYTRLFMNPLSTIAQATTQLQSAAAASERVFKFLNEEELEKEETKNVLKNAKGDIEFSHVRFGYIKNKIIIKDFNAKAKPGQKIAIVGPTGAGKTTMVNLLMRFYEINKGSITIDGVDTKNITRENVHDLFCMVLQDTWLFEGTIKENIIFNKKGVTEKDVINACKVVGLDHFIKSLPNGYNTVLGDLESLSQGQKQLLTIARSMLSDAPFLILDEATSSVDTRTEELVQKAMDKLTEGRTSFIIAHRLSTIKNADLILVMKNGNIIEQGNHNELMKQNGFYTELYNSQFQN
ncbi:MAG TPA: ABC transporter ATP-binding protein [Bacilli bacterium]|nr:ABC transporter ATP-binding protein [Bacilli bacterium]